MRGLIVSQVGPKYVGRHKFTTTSEPVIHIVDWKDVNNGGVEIHAAQPLHPETGELLNGVLLKNETPIEVTVDAFDENALFYTKKNQSRQCECVLFPTGYVSDEWILFVEMKYANDLAAAMHPANKYPDSMVDQIKQTVRFFRTKKIIPEDKVVNAIVSFPNLLSEFNAFVFPNNEIDDLFYDEGIIIRATNQAQIVDSKVLNLIA